MSQVRSETERGGAGVIYPVYSSLRNYLLRPGASRRKRLEAWTNRKLRRLRKRLGCLLAGHDWQMYVPIPSLSCRYCERCGVDEDE